MRGVNQYAAWQKWSNQQPSADPRVYWLAHMRPEEVTKFTAGMSSVDDKRLEANYQATKAAGLWTGTTP